MIAKLLAMNQRHDLNLLGERTLGAIFFQFCFSFIAHLAYSVGAALVHG